ncbi:hypothetical protein RSPO_c02592 [Ralstonia solanacearum Po82]|uniref:Uncharacterized protein n=1 Tax=Ralstonia solanacearum (strain Po82) TaxID=1031711 RepID=F6G3Q2_RALS8|nr:hypothetical protein RSPO_c02592 [Ralstonia solanacearum Po82]
MLERTLCFRRHVRSPVGTCVRVSRRSSRVNHRQRRVMLFILRWEIGLFDDHAAKKLRAVPAS